MSELLTLFTPTEGVNMANFNTRLGGVNTHIQDVGAHLFAATCTGTAEAILLAVPDLVGVTSSGPVQINFSPTRLV